MRGCGSPGRFLCLLIPIEGDTVLVAEVLLPWRLLRWFQPLELALLVISCGCSAWAAWAWCRADVVDTQETWTPLIVELHLAHGDEALGLASTTQEVSTVEGACRAGDSSWIVFLEILGGRVTPLPRPQLWKLSGWPVDRSRQSC